MKIPANRYRSLKRQAGQSIIEAVLLMTLMIGSAYFIKSALDDMQFFNRLVAGPWLNISGMVTNGVWMNIDDSYAYHPNLLNRHTSMFPAGQDYVCQ